MTAALRHTLRSLLRTPGFTAVAVLSLTLGIGAATAVFSLVNGILLGALPVPHPQELRTLRWSGVEPKLRDITGSYQVIGGVSAKSASGAVYLGTAQGQRALVNAFTPPLYRRLREDAAALAETMAFFPLRDVNVALPHARFQAEGLLVSDNFFTGLGLQPAAGRLLAPGDDAPGTPASVVITHGWWEREFARAPDVIGRSVVLNGNLFTIVGVLPRDFHGITLAGKAEFFVPLSSQPLLLPGRTLDATDSWWLQLLARIRPGVTDAQLQAGFDALFGGQVAGMMREPAIVIRDGRAGVGNNERRHAGALHILFAAVGVVVVVSCANLAGLSLARAAARQHDFALRAALGSGRWRLLGRGLGESLVLALAGGGLGLLLSLWLKDVLVVLLLGAEDGLRYDTGLDHTVLGFTLGMVLLTALLSGALPAWRSARTDPAGALKTSGSLAAPRLRWGRLLVVVQIASALLVVAGGGLYLQSLDNLLRVDPGFDIRRLLLAQINPRAQGLRGADLVAFYERTLEGLRRIPGVGRVTLMQQKLLAGQMSGGGFFTLPTRPEFDGRTQAHRLVVDEEFFPTMGIPLRLGRGIAAADTATAPRVVVVNDAFVRQYFAGENPIGQVLREKGSPGADCTIVGVCRDAKYTSIRTEVPPTVYYSFRQAPPSSVYFALRTALPPPAVVPAMQQVVAALSPELPFGEITTQEQVRDGKLAPERTLALLVGALAGLSVVISAIGVYGMMAFTTTRRTREIGVRIALGAGRGDIIRPVLAEAARLAAGGLLLGLPAVFLSTRLIESQLFGVRPTDPWVLGLGAAVLVLVTGLSAWLPARRAARVDPIIALRAE